MGQAKRKRDSGELPPDKDILDELLDYGERFARMILLEKREPELRPFYHLVTADRKHDAVVQCHWGQNSYEKDMVMAGVRKISRDIKAVAALHCSEAWAVHMKAPKGTPNTSWHTDRLLKRTGPPSQHPDRIEVVQLIAMDHVQTKSRSLQMMRDKQGGRLVALVRFDNDYDSLKGRMVDDVIAPPEET